MNSLSSALASCYDYLLVNPLRKIYLFGPAVVGFGFWQGLSSPEICAHITQYTETFWRENPTDCEALIEAKFYSFQISVEALLYFLLLYHGVKFVAHDIGALIKHKIFPRPQATPLCAIPTRTIVLYDKHMQQIHALSTDDG